MLRLMAFAENLRAERKRRDMTQAEFGEWLGVGQSTVSKWEKGDSIPSAVELRRLAGKLATTGDKLMSGEPSAAPLKSAGRNEARTTIERRVLRVLRLMSDDGQRRSVGLLASIAKAFPRALEPRPVRQRDENRGPKGRAGHRAGHDGTTTPA